MLRTGFRSPLHEIVMTTKTDFWSESCSAAELRYAVEHGATGAVGDPRAVVRVLRGERVCWGDRIGELIGANPSWTDEDVMWKVYEEVGVRGAELLAPVFKREGGRKGRFSIQAGPGSYGSVDRMVGQAIGFSALAPNMGVELPATSRGLAAVEEAVRRGVSVSAGACFTAAQAIAAGEAIERGLARREAEGLGADAMSPVCVIMVGRIDDWVGAAAERDGTALDPEHLPWAGVAVFKRVYGIYRERGFRARLAAAACRHQLHWSEAIGADAVLTIPAGWQRFVNASQGEVKRRIDEPAPPDVLAALSDRVAEFRRVYEPDGLTVGEFDEHGAAVRELRGLTASYNELTRVVGEDHRLKASAAGVDTQSEKGVRR